MLRADSYHCEDDGNCAVLLHDLYGNLASGMRAEQALGAIGGALGGGVAKFSTELKATCFKNNKESESAVMVRSVSKIIRSAMDCSDDETISSILNGRLVCTTTASSDSPLTSSDMALMLELENARTVTPLQPLLAQTKKEAVSLRDGNTFLRLINFIGRYSGGQRNERVDVMKILENMGFGSGSTFVLEIHPDETSEAESETQMAINAEVNDVSIVIAVDPLSLAGQRASGLLQLIREQLRLEIVLILIPETEYTKFPLQNFYRYSHGSTLRFNGLPRQHTLTMRVDHPEAWNVQATASKHDLDNLICDDVSLVMVILEVLMVNYLELDMY